jgi:hypothetical protein
VRQQIGEEKPPLLLIGWLVLLPIMELHIYRYRNNAMSEEAIGNGEWQDRPMFLRG